MTKEQRIIEQNNDKKEKKRLYDIIYRKRNKDKISKYMKEYRINNKEELVRKQKVHYLRNRKEIIRKNKEYYLLNKDEKKLYMKRYARENRDLFNKHHKLYRINNPHKNRIRDITKRKYPLEGNNCKYCNNEATQRHHYTKIYQRDKFHFVCDKCHIEVENEKKRS